MTTTHLWTLQLLLQLLPDACQCFLRFRTTLSYVTGTVMVNITRMSYTKTACMMLGNFFPWCDFSDFCWLICSTEVTLCSCKRNIIYFILFYLLYFISVTITCNRCFAVDRHRRHRMQTKQWASILYCLILSQTQYLRRGILQNRLSCSKTTMDYTMVHRMSCAVR